VVSDISETLREQKGRHEVAEEQDGDGESRGVLDAHSRSTPLRMRAVSAKNAPVRITNTRSDIFVELQSSSGLDGAHEGKSLDKLRLCRRIDGFLTRIDQNHDA
jgi:hypothetical protein